MLALEQKYGKIPLGNEPLQTENRPDSPEGQKDPQSLWLILAEFLQYNKKQMRKFKKTIEESQSAALVDYEIERRKTLQAYIKNQSKRKKEHVVLEGMEGQTEDQVRCEMQALALKQEQKSTKERIDKMRAVVSGLAERFNADKEYLQETRCQMGLKRFESDIVVDGPKVDCQWGKEEWKRMVQEMYKAPPSPFERRRTLRSKSPTWSTTKD